jgi:transcriptional regulator with XRE-family HTH domain
MTRSNGRAFNEWLRAQLKAKKMSQRQLAQQSGVDHSTISRLVRGDRMPSLGTATTLARGLRELGEDDDGPQYLGLMGGGVQNPTARVEYALRADEALGEAQVRQVMEYYLAVRMRRVGGTYSQGGGHPGLQQLDPNRAVVPRLAPAMNSPIVSQPALVAGGGRTTMPDSRSAMQRSPLAPRLRPVRSTDGY